jgi:hypothetical protein
MTKSSRRPVLRRRWLVARARQTIEVPGVDEGSADAEEPSIGAVATELNQREIEAPRGGRWYAASVARIRERLSLPIRPMFTLRTAHKSQ